MTSPQSSSVTDESKHVEDVVVSDPPIQDSTTTPTASAASENSNPPPVILENTVELIKEATDRTLAFLESASNETLLGCLVGLGAATYIVLGRVGLVFGGIVGGVYLHASWERAGHGQDDIAKSTNEVRKREAGVEVVRRLLDWKDKHASKSEDNEADPAYKITDYSELEPQTAAALNTLTDSIVNGYVKWWYSPLVPTDPSFPAACRATLSNFILAVATRMSRHRPAETFLDFVTHSSSIVVVFLNELSAVFAMFPNMSAEDAIYAYLRKNPESNLANLLDREQQDRKLQLVSEDILRSFLDKKAWQCAPIKAFLQQIFANLILEMTIQKCSKAEFINEWIVFLLEDGEPELMNVIDESMEAQQAVDFSQSATVEESRPASNHSQSSSTANRKRTISRAEEAMQEAMKEAQRLTQLMVEEDARRAQYDEKTARNGDDNLSGSVNNIQMPTSSQSNDAPVEDRSSISDTPQAQTKELVASPAITSFNSFDQLVTDSPTAARRKAALTFYRAAVSIFDDSDSNDKRTLRSQPEEEYFIQIEPRSTQFPGWIFPRSYEDFLTLHEIIRRIAVISGLDFTESHASLPSWKGVSQAQLRTELERYLADSLNYQPIAESEGMKRFMDKDIPASKTQHPATQSPGFWPNAAAFETMGKGVMGVFKEAEKVTGSGKAVFSGVTGAFGKIGPGGLKKAPTTPSPAPRQSIVVSQPGGRPSDEEKRSSLVFTEDGFVSGGHGASSEDLLSASISSPSSGRSSMSRKPSEVLSLDERLASSRTSTSTPPPPLPKRPSALDFFPQPFAATNDNKPATKFGQVVTPIHEEHIAFDGMSFVDIPTPSQPGTPALEHRSFDMSPNPLPPNRRHLREQPSLSHLASPKPSRRPSQESQRLTPLAKRPLSEREAQVTVELLFTAINELYTLSSAWTFRRTLLNAAKTFLLRPGNPQLETIRVLIQDSILDANTTDAGIAAHILKIRENALPTEEELKKWPAPKSADENEITRQKARRLLVERGMPQALTSVMGLAASGEALGKVFDCLQVGEVAQGLVFGLLLQALRALTA